MKTFAPINIIVHYPETKEGWRELRRRVAGVHADGVQHFKIRLPNQRKGKTAECDYKRYKRTD